MKKIYLFWLGAAAIIFVVWLILRACAGSADSSPEVVPAPAIPEAIDGSRSPKSRLRTPLPHQQFHPPKQRRPQKCCTGIKNQVARRRWLLLIARAGTGRVLLASQGGSLGTEMPPLPRGQAALELRIRSPPAPKISRSGAQRPQWPGAPSGRLPARPSTPDSSRHSGWPDQRPRRSEHPSHRRQRRTRLPPKTPAATKSSCAPAPARKSSISGCPPAIPHSIPTASESSPQLSNP